MASVVINKQNSAEPDESNNNDLPQISISHSSPITKLVSESSKTENVLQKTPKNGMLLPLNLLLTTNKTKIRLQITKEDILGNNDHDKTKNDDVKVEIECNHNKANNNEDNNLLSPKSIQTQSPSTTKKVLFNTATSSNNGPYKIGDLVLLSKHRQGLIRYRGELHYDSGTWFGIELIGGYKGYHDGSFQGVRYFHCGVHQGIFTKKDKIIRRLALTDFKNESKPSTPNTPSSSRDHHHYHHKSSSSKDKKILKKLGPRDIGKIKGWKPSREIYKSEEEKKTDEIRKAYKNQRRKNPSSRRSSLTEVEHALTRNGSGLFRKSAKKKAGPRDIGRISTKKSHWKPIKNADNIIKKENAKSFLDPSTFKSITQRRARASSSALLARKPGPRDVGVKTKPLTPNNKTKAKEKKKRRSRLHIKKPKFLTNAWDKKITRSRSMTPTPTRRGLKYDDDEMDDLTLNNNNAGKRNSKKRPKKPKHHHHHHKKKKSSSKKDKEINDHHEREKKKRSSRSYNNRSSMKKKRNSNSQKRNSSSNKRHSKSKLNMKRLSKSTSNIHKMDDDNDESDNNNKHDNNLSIGFLNRAKSEEIMSNNHSLDFNINGSKLSLHRITNSTDSTQSIEVIDSPTKHSINLSASLSSLSATLSPKIKKQTHLEQSHSQVIKFRNHGDDDDDDNNKKNEDKKSSPIVMSETTAINALFASSVDNDDDDIDDITSVVDDIKKQLEELEADDEWELQFTKSLNDTKTQQNKFKQKNNVIMNEMETDIHNINIQNKAQNIEKLFDHDDGKNE